MCLCICVCRNEGVEVRDNIRVLFFQHIRAHELDLFIRVGSNYLYIHSHHANPICYSVKYFLFCPHYWEQDLGPYSWYADSTTHRTMFPSLVLNFKCFSSTELNTSLPFQYPSLFGMLSFIKS